MNTDRLCRYAEAIGVALSSETAEKFNVYSALLKEWNEKINLTAIVEPDEVLVKHFLDSLTVVPHLPSGAFSMVDIGTGAGFPGIPVALARPDVRLTLLDGLNKRLVFLETVCRELGIDAARVHARAEDAGRLPAFREQFDVATARAVAAMPLLCEYALPLVKRGGVMIAMKGPDGTAEAATAKNAIATLGGFVKETASLSLPLKPEAGEETVGRTLVIVEKNRQTPPQYPRPSAKIAKQGAL